MDDRKQQLLQFIIEEYIVTAEPVGSSFVTKKGALDVSAATIRNEMRDLEEAGYLMHPHTSAGRVPTDKGFQYYVDTIMKPESASRMIQKKIQEAVSSGTDVREQIKHVAKATAEYLESSVIVAFNPTSVYYTGISYLFAQPEFRDSAYTVHISPILFYNIQFNNIAISIIYRTQTFNLIEILNDTSNKTHFFISILGD